VQWALPLAALVAVAVVAAVLGWVAVAAGAVLALITGFGAALILPGPTALLERNLPPGGRRLLLSVLAVLVAILAESAEPVGEGAGLLVLLGTATLLGGVFVVGLRVSRFRYEVAQRGLPTPARGKAAADDRFRLAGPAAGLGLAVVAVALMIGENADNVAVAGAAVFVVIAAADGAMALAELASAARGSHRSRSALKDGVKALAPEVILHFSGGMKTLYQLEHWVDAIRATGCPCMLLFRERPTFDAAAGLDIPAVLVEDFGDLDLAVVPSVAAVMYVNTATKNNHLVRFDRPAHVQLHHGDSDKPPSSGKTMRLYDAHFVAGPAGRARLESVGVAASAIFEVGRPVTDAAGAGPAAAEAILYAPTWEGAHADSDLSSVQSLGEKLIRAIAATGRPLVFRPHPLTGTADAAVGQAAGRLADLTVGLGGRVDDASGPLVAAFAGAALLVCDVSAVLVDWYAVDRPVVVTDLAGLGPAALARRYPTTAGAVAVTADDSIEALLSDVLEQDPQRSARREAAAMTLGDVGRAQERFAAALAAVSRPR